MTSLQISSNSTLVTQAKDFLSRPTVKKAAVALVGAAAVGTAATLAHSYFTSTPQTEPLCPPSFPNITDTGTQCVNSTLVSPVLPKIPKIVTPIFNSAVCHIPCAPSQVDQFFKLLSSKPTNTPNNTLTVAQPIAKVVNATVQSINSTISTPVSESTQPVIQLVVPTLSVDQQKGALSAPVTEVPVLIKSLVTSDNQWSFQTPNSIHKRTRIIEGSQSNNGLNLSEFLGNVTDYVVQKLKGAADLFTPNCNKKPTPLIFKRS